MFLPKYLLSATALLMIIHFSDATHSLRMNQLQNQIHTIVNAPDRGDNANNLDTYSDDYPFDDEEYATPQSIENNYQVESENKNDYNDDFSENSQPSFADLNSIDETNGDDENYNHGFGNDDENNDDYDDSEDDESSRYANAFHLWDKIKSTFRKGWSDTKGAFD